MRSVRRFSLKTLLVAITLCGVLLAAWRVKVEPYRQQKAAVAMVGRLSGSIVSVPLQEPAWEKWLVQAVLGEDAFAKVTEVELSGVALTEGDAWLLSGLPWVEKIDLSGTAMTDVGVGGLTPLRRVRQLNLSHCGVTNEGLAALGAKPVLMDLRLTSCEITDESIGALAEWKALRLLMVRWTRLSQAGVDQLAAELPDCEVVFQPGGGD